MSHYSSRPGGGGGAGGDHDRSRERERDRNYTSRDPYAAAGISIGNNSAQSTTSKSTDPHHQQSTTTSTSRDPYYEQSRSKTSSSRHGESSYDTRDDKYRDERYNRERGITDKDYEKTSRDDKYREKDDRYKDDKYREERTTRERDDRYKDDKYRERDRERDDRYREREKDDKYRDDKYRDKYKDDKYRDERRDKDRDRDRERDKDRERDRERDKDREERHRSDRPKDDKYRDDSYYRDRSSKDDKYRDERREKDRDTRYREDDTSRLKSSRPTDRNKDDIKKESRYAADDDVKKSNKSDHYSSSSSSKPSQLIKKESLDELGYDTSILTKNKELLHLNIPIEVFGYSNHNNPFNDARLSEPFMWRKRDKLYLSKGLPVPLRDQAFLRKQAEENKRHIQAVQQRRKDMEQQREERDEMHEQMMRDVEAAKAQDYELEQSRNALLLLYKQCEIRTLSHTELPIHIFIKFVLFKLKVTNYPVLLKIGISSADSKVEHQRHMLFITEYLEIDRFINIIDIINHLEFDDVVRLYVDILHVLDITKKTLAYQKKMKQKLINMQQQQQNWAGGSSSTEQLTQAEHLKKLALSGDAGNAAAGGGMMTETEEVVTDGDIEFWETLATLISRQIDLTYLLKLGFTYEHAHYIILSANHKMLLTFGSIQNYYKLYLSERVFKMMLSSTQIINASLQHVKQKIAATMGSSTAAVSGPNAAAAAATETKYREVYHDLHNITSTTRYIDLNEGDDAQLPPQFKDVVLMHRKYFLQQNRDSAHRFNPAELEAATKQQQQKAATGAQYFQSYLAYAKGLTTSTAAAPPVTNSNQNPLSQYITQSAIVNSRVQQLLKQSGMGGTGDRRGGGGGGGSGAQGGDSSGHSKLDLAKITNLLQEQFLLQQCVPLEWQLETAANIPLYAIEDVYRILHYDSNPQNQLHLSEHTTSSSGSSGGSTIVKRNGANGKTSVVAYSDDPQQSFVMSLTKVKQLKKRSYELMQKAEELSKQYNGQQQQIKDEQQHNVLQSIKNETGDDFSTQIQQSVGISAFGNGGVGDDEELMPTLLPTTADDNNNNNNNNNDGFIDVNTADLQRLPPPPPPLPDSNMGPTILVKVEQGQQQQPQQQQQIKSTRISQEQHQINETDYRLWAGIYHELKYVEARSKLYLYYRRLMLLRAQQLQQQAEQLQQQQERREQEQALQDGFDDAIRRNRIGTGATTEEGVWAPLKDNNNNNDNNKNNKDQQEQQPQSAQTQQKDEQNEEFTTTSADDEVDLLDIDANNNKQTTMDDNDTTTTTSTNIAPKKPTLDLKELYCAYKASKEPKDKKATSKSSSTTQQQQQTSSSSTSNALIDLSSDNYDNDQYDDFGDVKQHITRQLTKQQQLYQQELRNQLDKRLQLRKPRFISKVRTGFAWNKYNRTHYDKSNPPPKVVQGYRFHIFYPDLIDQTVTPSYQLIIDQNDHDYCHLKFFGGLPYEPITFKIVRGDWDRERTHGFKSYFARGVLTLSFNFKRVGYRR